MVRLTAIYLDVFGAVRFRIEPPSAEPITTDRAEEAARVLLDLGVEEPERYVEMVRDWGTVDIVSAGE